MNEWISVNDRLPEQYGKYLIVTSGELSSAVITVARYDVERDKWKAAQAHAVFENVTHWMPLPKPPEVTT